MSEVIADTPAAVESAPVTETIAPTSAPEVVEATPEQALDDELSKIYRKANPDREPDGKYAAKEKPPEPEKAPEIPPMPVSWAKANEQLWQELTPAARDIVLKREADTEKGVAKLKEQYEPYKGLEKALEPHKALLSSMGLNPVQGVERLITFHQAMMADKYRGILEIANSYGVDLPRMFAPQGQRPGQNSVIDRLAHEVQALKAERAAEQQARVQTIEKDLSGQIETFSKDPKNEHFETLKPTMAQLLVSGVAQDLSDAYDKAARLNPEIYAQIEAKTKASIEEKVRAEQAKKVAAINVKSSAANTASPTNLDDELRAIYRRNRGT